MNYQLRRMKRKTVGIYITKEGEIGRAFASKGYFLRWNALFAARSAGGRAARRPCGLLPQSGKSPFAKCGGSLCPTRWKGPPAGAHHLGQNALGFLLGKRRAQFFLAPPVRAAGSNGLRCRPRACASDRIQSLFSFLGNCRGNSAGLQGPPSILERSAGEPPAAGVVKRMRKIHKSVLLLMQWKERSG